MTTQQWWAQIILCITETAYANLATVERQYKMKKMGRQNNFNNNDNKNSRRN
jgi:hypothetical protein